MQTLYFYGTQLLVFLLDGKTPKYQSIFHEFCIWSDLPWEIFLALHEKSALAEDAFVKNDDSLFRFNYLIAIASISSNTPFGSFATSTQERAGHGIGKYFA